MLNVKKISDSIDNIISSFRKPANVISAIIMLCAMTKRPGLSCIVSTSNILQDIGKRGIPTDNLPDGSKNLMNEMIASIVYEVFRAIKEDSNIQMAIPPGALTINVNGVSPTGPITAVGTNIAAGSGVGLMQ